MICQLCRKDEVLDTAKGNRYCWACGVAWTVEGRVKVRRPLSSEGWRELDGVMVVKGDIMWGVPEGCLEVFGGRSEVVG